MVRPIRVLLTVPHLTSTAAPYRHMIALATHLPRDQFHLTICSLRKNGYEETKPVLDNLGVPVFVARFRPRGKTIRHLPSWWRDQKEIDQYGPFDIRHSMDFSSLPLEALVARLKHIPYVYTQRNMLEGGHRLLQKAKIRLSTRIICISDATENHLHGLGTPSSKIEKVYNGIDLAYIESQLHPNVSLQPGLVLFVGHTIPRKRQEDAIRTIGNLVDEFPSLHLALAGSTYDVEYYNYLVTLVEELGLTERVTFLGNRKDIPQLMQKAQALLLCSSSEALPLSLLEAMAVGVPIIASAVNGNKELIDHGQNGFLVPPGDIDSYTESLRQLLLQPSLAKTFVRCARSKVEEKFSVSRMVQQTASLYLELADRRV